jgi:hypothetical protein
MVSSAILRLLTTINSQTNYNNYDIISLFIFQKTRGYKIRAISILAQFRSREAKMKRIAFLLITTWLLTATACGSSQVKTPPDGEYKRDEVTNSGTNTLSIKLNQGHFQMPNTAQGLLWDGTYQVNGDKITFNSQNTTAAGKALCGSKDTFTYQWSFDAKKNQMVFKVVDDTCGLRVSGTDAHPWAYQAAQK